MTLYTIDTAHSDAAFTVRHMVVAKVRGNFKISKGVLKFNKDNPAASTVNVTLDSASVSTGDAKRDDHLRSADFFDVANHPHIVFESTAITPKGDGHQVDGMLTIRGVTKPISFDADFTGFVTDPWGNPRAAAEVAGKVNRTHFGLTWNQVLEAGSLLVGEDIKFNISVQLVEKAEVAA